MKKFKSFIAENQKEASNFTGYGDCLTFENSKGKCFPLLYADLEEALKALWVNGAQVDRDLDGNRDYDETRYREAFGNALADQSGNSVQTLLGSQTPNTVKALSLYSGFLLQQISGLTENDYPLLRADTLEPLFSLERPFDRWLERTQKLAQSSRKKYSHEAGKFLSKILMKPFFAISTIEELDDAQKVIEASPQFQKVNDDGKGMYSRPINLYRQFLESRSPDCSGSIPFKKIQSFADYHLSYSLLAKPFTILTGASGTGKTKLAKSLATFLGNSDQSNSSVIAVGADWTDNRNVLGFVNHLRTDDSGNPTYQTTPVLELLLQAADDDTTPYFLILDEMNLSHVERYFSDFLSVMEQKDGRFDLHSEGPADDDDFTLPASGDGSTGVPRKLPYPPNLFVIGTVNIDETTYMFSPKVLDRANVIEFKVEESEFEEFLKNPNGYPEMEKAIDGVAKGFLELALQAREDGGLDPVIGDTSKKIREHLMALFKMMQEARFEFAYRTGHEIFRYLRVCQHLADNQADWQSSAWKHDLDTQILQKILPKLHGSIGRIAPLITALSHYCESGETSGAPSLRDLVKSPFNEEEQAKALFPRSAAKLREMAKTLSSEQFVSFIS